MRSTARSGYPRLTLVAGPAADPVVEFDAPVPVLVVVLLVSGTIFHSIDLNGTATSRSPIPKNPPRAAKRRSDRALAQPLVEARERVLRGRERAGNGRPRQRIGNSVSH